MATAVSVRPPSTSSKLGRPLPSPLHTSINGDNSTLSISSPGIVNRATPSSASFSGLDQNVEAANGPLARTRQKQRPKPKNLMDNASRQPKLVEPYVRTTEHILHKFRSRAPSLILHLHPTHFRFDQQDGTFGYNSPMKLILEHLKSQTVPHDILEELFQGNVVFYDGCLIVEVHDHKSGPIKSASGNPDTLGRADSVSFSIHNYHHHMIPSPYVPYPKSNELRPPSDGKKFRDGVKEEGSSLMPAPDRPSKDSGNHLTKRSRVFTTVLHPTPLSLHREISILATTAAPDTRAAGRRQASGSRDGATPVTAIPSTPLSSIPSTPTISSRSAPKRQKMLLEEKDIHSFEAEILRSTEPPLFLDPVESFDEAQAVMKTLTHPLHNLEPTHTRGRKRTTAELAADEAQAAEEERIALLMDERLEPSLSSGYGTGAGETEGHNKAKDFEANFARFKALEDIKRNLEEMKERKKEQEAMQSLAAKRSREQAEQVRMHDAKVRRQQAEMARVQQQKQMQQQQQQQQQQMHQQQLLQQQQQQQKMLVPQRKVQASHASQIHPSMMQGIQQNLMQRQTSQVQQSSPAMSHHSPVNTSPLMNNSAMNNPQAQAAHIVPSTPGHGQVNSPRPGSAMQARQNAGAKNMARQISQQRSQPGQSRNGTPQMQSATPHTMNNVPNGRITPQMSQGSPIPGTIQGTPMMPLATMGGSQMNGTPNLQQQQQAQNTMFQQQQQQRRNILMAQTQMGGSPQGTNLNQMSPAQQQAYQHQRPMQSQILQQQQQQQQLQNANGGQTLANPALNAITSGLTQQQQQEFQNMASQQRNEVSMARRRQAQSSQDYSRQISQHIAMQAQNQGQGQVQNVSMQQRQQQQQQAPPGYSGGIGPSNGVPVAQSMSQQNAPQSFQQRNLMQNHEQMRPNVPMQQPNQQQLMQRQMHMRGIRDQFYQHLKQKNGRTLPDDAAEQFDLWFGQQQRLQQQKQQEAQRLQQQHQQAQGMQNVGGNMQGMQVNASQAPAQAHAQAQAAQAHAMAQAQATRGVRGNAQTAQQYQNALVQQKQSFMQQHQARSMQQPNGIQQGVGGPQNMMNGMSPQGHGPG